MKTLQALIALFACAFLPLHAASLKDLTYATIDGKISIIRCDLAAEGNLVIPDTIEGKPVAKIASDAFSYSGLTSIAIPDSVTTIGNNAFRGCRLKSIVIGNSVTSIGGCAFLDCRSLRGITIPDSVESIGDPAFGGCVNLPKIEVGEKNPSYTDVNGVLFNKEKTMLLNYPAGKPDTAYEIPDTVTRIRAYAFSDSAFHKCTNLTSITIPDSFTNIEGRMFGGCSSLTSITIPDSVTTIGSGAFMDCTSLKNITIPDSVTSIGKITFSKCTKLTDITFLGAAPKVEPDAFKDVPDDAIAFVTPKALKSFGQVGDKWNGLTLKIGSASIATDPKEVAAGHSDEKELILLSSHLNTVEADFPVLLKKREAWKIARINAQLRIDTAYLTSLKKIRTSMVQKEEIAAARAIDQAIKEGARTDDEPAALTKARQVRYDALLAAMKPIDQQYWKELKKVKEDVQTLGDLERLEVVLSEITRVLAPYK